MAEPLKRALRILLSAAVVLLIIYTLRGQLQQLRPADIGQLLRRTGSRVWFLIPLNAAILWLMALRWGVFLREQHPAAATTGRLVLHFLSGFAISYLTPGTQFGGEPVRSWLLTRRGDIPPAAALLSVLCERGTDLAANMLVLALLLPLAMQPVFPVQTGLLLLLLPGLLLLGFRMRKSGFACLPGRIRERLRRSVAGYRLSGSAWKAAAGYSLLIWLVMLLEFWYLYRLAGIDLSPSGLALCLLAVRLAFLMPLPAAAGVLEGGQLAAATMLDIPAGAALAVTLLMRLRDLLLVAAGLLWLFYQRKKAAGEWDAKPPVRP